jgi:hypothetical protein
MRISVTVCDMCEPDVRRDALTYTVSVETDRFTADLCAEHAEPLRRVMGLGKPAAPASAKPAPRAKRTTVKPTTAKRSPGRPRKAIADLMVSLDEIDNLK